MIAATAIPTYDALGRIKEYRQCSPYNCGTSAWLMTYNYDSAGDVTSYTHPAGFTVTQGVDVNQRPTSLTYGANMAVSNITYTGWGAISTMCGGQGCAQSQETRQYNNRLQPVLMELGNSGNLSADYSLTYSYTGNANPPCTIPQGAGDNGSITGETYTDNVNAGYSHTFTYCYDAVNRLTHAVASGSPAYDLMYSYDQYGNGTCVPGSGGGLCPAMSYDSSTNHLTSIGSTAIGYDAAGNQLNDIWSTYEYDAEGRVTHSYSSGQWQYPMYNALGQRVQDYQGTDPMTLSYPIDIFGQRTGTFAQWPSQNWTGWNVYWSQIAGQRLNMGGASAYIDHSDAVGSTTMETDPAGAVQWDVTHYPLGGVFQEQGARQSEVVMGLDWQVNDPLIPSATREVSTALGRWTTPDPLGGNVTNPQSLNRYAYVLNNPTTFTDPSGLGPCDSLDSLDCGPPCDAFDAEGCQNGCNPVWAESCVLYCYYLGTCNGRNGGGGGGSSGGGGGGTAPPPSAPPVGQRPVAGMGNALFGGLVTCTYAQVKIGGIQYPGGPTACILAGLGISSAIAYVLSHPWQLSWVVPLDPVPGVLGVGPAGTVAWNPPTRTLCVGVGAGVSAGHEAAFGPITYAKTLNGAPAFPSGVNGVLSGSSASAGFNFFNGVGGQITVNGSGIAAGPTLGVPGFSAAYTYSACGSF